MQLLVAMFPRFLCRVTRYGYFRPCAFQFTVTLMCRAFASSRFGSVT